VEESGGGRPAVGINSVSVRHGNKEGSQRGVDLVRGNGGSLNSASVHLHLGIEGRLLMVYNTAVSVMAVVAAGRARGRRKSHEPHGPNRPDGS
jgi:hypothetical protein